MEYISAVFQKQINSQGFEFCLPPHHITVKNMILRKRLPSKKKGAEILIRPIDLMCFERGDERFTNLIDSFTNHAIFEEIIQIINMYGQIINFF